jgi:tRNA nucleotidyltransferase (CCA-adding enzyme)
MSVTLFEVGGCVRDDLLGVRSKDIDFAVEAESFEAMREWMVNKGFTIFVETEQFFTIRAHFPKGWEHAGMDTSRLTADFVLARKDGAYTDGRRPDSTAPGTIFDDLARRDFTVNAMARTPEGDLLDPHGGQRDLENRLLACVGNAEDRFREDALRALRAIRFAVTKGFTLSAGITAALASDWLPPLLASVSKERQREEMRKAMHADTLATLDLLARFPKVRDVVFSDGLWLEPTLSK